MMIKMSEDQLKEEKKRVYASTRQDLLTRDLSNSEKYDNAILTLSTGVLAISLAFIKDIIPLEKTRCLILLILSWCAFGAAIISTLISFLSSQMAIKRQLEYAEKYYLNEEEEYLKRKNSPKQLTDVMNYTSGILFIIGIIVTIIFVSINIAGENVMTNKSSTKDGATIPVLQKVTKDIVKKGANIPDMQPVGQSTTQQSTVQDVNQSSGNNDSSK